MKKAMDVILKKATLCLLLGGILAILLLSACTSAESGNSDSIIDKSHSMGADEDNQEASEVTILSVDQPALSLSIPKAWEDIAIIKRQTDNSPQKRRTVHYSFSSMKKQPIPRTRQWATYGAWLPLLRMPSRKNLAMRISPRSSGWRAMYLEVIVTIFTCS